MKFIVTDPCYLVDDEKHPGVWQAYCRMIDEHGRPTAEADAYLEKELGFRICTASTGDGDWGNSLDGAGVIQPRFCADAGLVCVAELPVNGDPQYLKEIQQMIDSGSVALFETARGISITFDQTASDWTVVRIFDETGCEIISSLEPGETSVSGRTYNYVEEIFPDCLGQSADAWVKTVTLADGLECTATVENAFIHAEDSGDGRFVWLGHDVSLELKRGSESVFCLVHVCRSADGSFHDNDYDDAEWIDADGFVVPEEMVYDFALKVGGSDVLDERMRTLVDEMSRVIPVAKAEKFLEKIVHGAEKE